MSLQTTVYQLLVTVDMPGSIDTSTLDRLDRCIRRELRNVEWPHVEFELYVRWRRPTDADATDDEGSAWADTIPAVLE